MKFQKGDRRDGYNCGCGMPHTDRDKPKNMTHQNFAEAANAMDQLVKEAKMNALAPRQKRKTSTGNLNKTEKTPLP